MGHRWQGPEVRGLAGRAHVQGELVADPAKRRAPPRAPGGEHRRGLRAASRFSASYLVMASKMWVETARPKEVSQISSAAARQGVNSRGTQAADCGRLHPVYRL